MLLAPPYFDHRYRRHELEMLFAEWDEVEIRPVGGIGTGLAFHLGSLMAGGLRRLSVLRVLGTPGYLAINALGWVVEMATKPLAKLVPAIYIVVSRRSDG